MPNVRHYTGQQTVSNVLGFQLDAIPVEGMHIRGSRANNTAIYYDAVRIRGTVQLPKRAINKIAMYTSGLPARYGDTMGAVVLIEPPVYSDKMRLHNDF